MTGVIVDISEEDTVSHEAIGSAPMGPEMECRAKLAALFEVRFSRWDHEEQVRRTHSRGKTSRRAALRGPPACCALPTFKDSGVDTTSASKVRPRSGTCWPDLANLG